MESRLINSKSIYAIRKNAEAMDISFPSALLIRKRFLQGELVKWKAFANMETDEIPYGTVVEINEELMSISRAEHSHDKPANLPVTEEQIEEARNFPIDKLISFVKGKIACPFHDDKNPSAYHGTRTNRLICPVCNKTWSALDILIKRDGMSFYGALKGSG
jgi:hypothetical protein